MEKEKEERKKMNEIGKDTREMASTSLLLVGKGRTPRKREGKDEGNGTRERQLYGFTFGWKKRGIRRNERKKTNEIGREHENDSRAVGLSEVRERKMK